MCHKLGQAMKDAPPPPPELHKRAKIRLIPFLHPLVLPSGPVSRPAFIQAVIKKEEEEAEEGVTGLYTPHSWKLMGLFTTQCRACEKMRRSEPGAPSFPVLGPDWRNDLKPHTC